MFSGSNNKCVSCRGGRRYVGSNSRGKQTDRPCENGLHTPGRGRYRYHWGRVSRPCALSLCFACRSPASHSLSRSNTAMSCAEPYVLVPCAPDSSLPYQRKHDTSCMKAACVWQGPLCIPHHHFLPRVLSPEGQAQGGCWEWKDPWLKPSLKIPNHHKRRRGIGSRNYRRDCYTPRSQLHDDLPCGLNTKLLCNAGRPRTCHGRTRGSIFLAVQTVGPMNRCRDCHGWTPAKK